MKDKNFAYESSKSSTKLLGLAHLFYNYRRHSDDARMEMEAWAGISLILEEIAEDCSETAEYISKLEREPRVANIMASSK